MEGPQPARRLARWMELSHIQLEHRSDRFLHDQAGLVQLTPSRLQALLYDDGERFDPLYANDAFIRKLQDDDPDLLPVEYVRLANDDSTGFGAKLRAAADCAASSKSPESFHASVAAGRFRFEVRTLADHAGRRIQLVDCTDIMGERQYQDRKEALLLGVSDGFDGVYLINSAGREGHRAVLVSRRRASGRDGAHLEPEGPRRSASRRPSAFRGHARTFPARAGGA